MNCEFYNICNRKQVTNSLLPLEKEKYHCSHIDELLNSKGECIYRAKCIQNLMKRFEVKRK